MTYEPWNLEEIRPADDRQAEQLALALIETHDDDFAGVHHTADGGLGIKPATAEGTLLASTAAIPGVAIDPSLAQLSISEASETGERLFSELPDEVRTAVGLWAADPRDGGLLLVLNRQPGELDRNAIEGFADRGGVRIRVLVAEGYALGASFDDDRQTDLAPYAGGARYAPAHWGPPSGDVGLRSPCTTGFPYKRSGTPHLLTAGHCHPRNREQNHAWILDHNEQKHQWVGRKCCSTYASGTGTVPAGDDEANHGDLALLDLSVAGRAAGTSVFWGPKSTDNKIPVTGREAPATGQQVCYSGFASGSDCGLEVWLTNTNQPVAGETVKQGDVAISSQAQDCPDDGDSGAPVVINHFGAETYAIGVGIHSWSATDEDDEDDPFSCVMGFTGVEEAKQAWGGGLNQE